MTGLEVLSLEVLSLEFCLLLCEFLSYEFSLDLMRDTDACEITGFRPRLYVSSSVFSLLSLESSFLFSD